MMNKEEQMVELYGGPNEAMRLDDIVFIRREDGTVERIEDHDIEEFIDLHPTEDFVIIRVREDVVECIAEDAREERKPYVGVTNGEAEAIHFMTQHWGPLYVEVLMAYTTLIQGGMRPGPASYAALLQWDISVEEA